MKTVEEMKQSKELTVGAANCILRKFIDNPRKAHEVTLEDIANNFTCEEVKRWRGVGTVTYDEIVSVMCKNGLQLKHDLEKKEEKEEKELIITEIVGDDDSREVRIIKQKLADIEREMNRLSSEWNVLVELLSVIENESE
jgi:hypothetical protein